MNTLGTALRATFGRRAWLTTMLAAQTTLLGTLSFALVLMFVVAGASTVWLIPIGLPLLWLALALAHQFARFESWRYRAYLGEPLPLRPVPPGASPGSGWLGRAWSRMWARLRAGGSWLETVYALFVLPLLLALVGLGWASLAIYVFLAVFYLLPRSLIRRWLGG